jgi:hypothetical protein
MANTKLVEEFSFTAEQDPATACSLALRKVKSLAESAPLGRLFASIATLSEVSQDANRQIQANNLRAASIALRSFGDTEDSMDFQALQMAASR